MTDELPPLSSHARRVLEHARAADPLDALTRARIERALEARLAGGHVPKVGPRSVAPKIAGGIAGKAAFGVLLAAAATWGTYEHFKTGAIDRTMPAPAVAPASVAVRTPVHAGVQVEPSTTKAHQQTPQAVEAPAESAPAKAHAVAVPGAGSGAAHMTTSVATHVELAGSDRAAADQGSPTAVAATATDTEATPSGSPAGIARDTPEPTGAAEPTPDGVAEELAFLKRAQAALNAGDPQAALAALRAHQERFPHGKLNEACEVERIVALCAAGEKSASRRAAERFLNASPGSPFADRVRSTCAAE